MSQGRAPRRQQGAVRKNHFEKSLDVFNEEISRKMAHSFARYHEAEVAPLAARLAALEMPWYQPLVVRLQRLVVRLRRGPVLK
jgi:hypothetical protein